MSWPRPNEYGVFLREQCEVLVLEARDAAEGKRRSSLSASAEIMLVQVGRERWAASAALALHSGDFRDRGSLPRDDDDACYPDRDSALECMAEYLLEQMDRVFRDREEELKRNKGARVKTDFSRINPSLAECREAERVARWAARLIGEEAPEQLGLELALA